LNVLFFIKSPTARDFSCGTRQPLLSRNAKVVLDVLYARALTPYYYNRDTRREKNVRDDNNNTPEANARVAAFDFRRDFRPPVIVSDGNGRKKPI